MIYTTAADVERENEQQTKHGYLAFLRAGVHNLLPFLPSRSAAYYCLRRVDSASLLLHYWRGARVEQRTFEPKGRLELGRFYLSM